LPAFLRDDLTQQWGIPPEHRSSAESVHKFEQFPAIPIPFCLRFREGSAMMRSVSSKDLDVFASLRGKGSLAGASKLNTPAPPLEIKSSTSVAKALVAPPRLIRRNRELESLKAEASTFFSSPRSTRSRDSDNELLSRKEPKSSTTVKVVEGSKASDSPTPAMVYKRVRLPPRSRKNTSIASKGKARQIVVTDEDSASNEVESEDEGEGEDEEEDAAPPPKRLKTTPSISASIPRRSAKRVSVPKRVTKATAKPAPKHSSGSTFQPVLLADVQGRLRLPEQSTGEFTPFPKFAHARNSAALNRENPLLAINPEFLELGSILETQNACFTMQDLMQVNRVIRDSSPPPDSAAEALEGLNDVEKGSADEGTSSQVGGSIPMELDLPMIESLAEPTLSPEKGTEPAQTL
ncbi:hypothetical protein EV368DRAFT_70133, partial [Lentinula lateritia]